MLSVLVLYFPAWNSFSFLHIFVPLVLRAEVQPLLLCWRLKFNINTDRAIFETRRDGGSRASALNSGNTVRSAAICSAVQRANLKAGAKTEWDNDETEPCYLVEHKATEKPFDIFPFKPRGTV